MNKGLKEKIIELRKNGSTYNEIKVVLSCSKSTISYHLGEGQKEKNKIRNDKFFKNNPVCKKLDGFKSRKGLMNKLHKFNITERGGVIRGKNICSVYFNAQDVINRIGSNPTCYLTGESIDLDNPASYNFDHIVPASKGGNNSLDNLGICLKEANQAKNDLMLDDLLNLCEKILKFHKRI